MTEVGQGASVQPANVQTPSALRRVIAWNARGARCVMRARCASACAGVRARAKSRSPETPSGGGTLSLSLRTRAHAIEPSGFFFTLKSLGSNGRVSRKAMKVQSVSVREFWTRNRGLSVQMVYKRVFVSIPKTLSIPRV